MACRPWTLDIYCVTALTSQHHSVINASMRSRYGKHLTTSMWTPLDYIVLFRRGEAPTSDEKAAILSFTFFERNFRGSKF